MDSQSPNRDPESRKEMQYDHKVHKENWPTILVRGPCQSDLVVHLGIDQISMDLQKPGQTCSLQGYFWPAMPYRTEVPSKQEKAFDDGSGPIAKIGHAEW